MEKLDTTQLGVEATSMAIREVLMEYFKGTCVENMVENSNVRLKRLEQPRGRYQYQRLEMENQQQRVITLAGVPIMTVQKAPEKIVIYASVLNRSPQFREVYRNINTFLEKYMMGVEISHSRKGVIYA